MPTIFILSVVWYLWKLTGCNAFRWNCENQWLAGSKLHLTRRAMRYDLRALFQNNRHEIEAWNQYLTVIRQNRFGQKRPHYRQAIELAKGGFGVGQPALQTKLCRG